MTTSSGIKREQVEVSSLPPQMRRLIALLGFEATVKLLRARGGRRVWVPNTASADRVLAPVIGLRALKTLVAHYGGEMIELPGSDKILIQARNRMLLARRAEGASYADLAEEFGLSRRWVIALCSTPEDDVEPPQGRLFGPCADRKSGAH